MIKTLKVHNGGFAHLGNPQVQSTVDDVANEVKKQSTTVRNIKSPAPVSPHQVITDTMTLKVTSDSLKSVVGSTLQSLVTSLSSDSSMIVPTVQSKFNSILPSYALGLEPSTDSHKKPTTLATRVDSVEQRMGVARLRPEIITLTSFLPLFDSTKLRASVTQFMHQVERGGIDPTMTDAGRFVETQIAMRSLRQANGTHLIRSLRNRFTHLDHEFRIRSSEFENSLTELKETMTFLYQFIKGLDILRSSLDLRNDLHNVDVIEQTRSFIGSHTKIRLTTQSHPLLDQSQRFIPPVYTVSDVLVRLGYNESSVKNVFTSTKMWLQLMEEMKDILTFHSLEFIDAEPVRQRADNSPSSITDFSLQRFYLKKQPVNIVNLDTISTMRSDDLTVTYMSNVIDAGYRSLYDNINFKTEEARFGAIINLLSKEFRYSTGLGKQEVQRLLADTYGFTPAQTGNVNVFNAVIGRAGTSIDDIPSTPSDTLTSIGQRRISDGVSVLPLESKYIDTDDASLTPGGVYYVDSVLDTNGQSFNTQRLDAATKLFETAHMRFGTFINEMNVLGYRDLDVTDAENSKFASILGSPKDLAETFLRYLVNVNNGDTLPSLVNDNLAAVYAEAAKNDKLKSILFLFCITRMSRSYFVNVPAMNSSVDFDNTPLADELARRALSVISNGFIGQPKHNKKDITYTSMMSDAVRTSLKNGTALTVAIETIMSQIVTEFKATAQVGDTTRYGGYLDTIIAMTVFDLLISMIAKYSNQRIVSITPVTSLNDSYLFTMSRTTINHRNSSRDLITRLEREASLVQQVTFCAMNTMRKLGGAFRNHSNTLKSQVAIERLQMVASKINDPELLKLVLSEQQIMLLASTVTDLYTRVSKNHDKNDVTKSLDDSAIGEQLQNALLGLLSSPAYTSSRGFNKKVLTVGIPLGFTNLLKQRISLSNLKKSSFVDKQNDFVVISVYRVDMLNSDVVYKPKRFTFEMSRFPVRDQQTYLDLPERPTLGQIINSIPTRDLGNGLDSMQPAYGNAGGETTNRGLKSAFDDESYSFLTDQQKNDIITNHVVSYLFEVYVRLMTGTSLADYDFHLAGPPRLLEPEFMKTLIEHRINQIVDSTSDVPVSNQPRGGILFSATASERQREESYPSQQSPTSLEQQKSIGTVTSNLSSLSHRKIAGALHEMGVISSLAHVVTPLSDGASLSTALLEPKQFDRVFNIVIDPDEFEIDYDHSVRTPHGKRVIEQLIMNGDALPLSEIEQSAVINRGMSSNIQSLTNQRFVQSRVTDNQTTFRMRERDLSEGDMAFDKFFVTIETLDEEADR